MNCQSKGACHRIWAIIVLVFAVVSGLLVTVAAPHVGLMNLAMMIRFLQFMLIILGVGALIKYLFSCGPCGCRCIKKEAGEHTETQTKD